jgi:hypothetical protein
MFYASEGRGIQRYDVVSDTQLTNFATLPGSGNAFALRLLPPGDGSGGLLVADRGNIKRLDGSGAVVQTYDTASDDFWFALNLDPNGTSFWSGDASNSRFYRFNIASGAVEVGPISTETATGTLFGLCVRGELVAAQPTPTSTPTTVSTATATPTGEASATPSATVTPTPASTNTATSTPTTTPTSGPTLDVDPQAGHNFGDVAPGGSRTFVFTATNTGGGTLNATATAACAGFSVSPLNFTLGPGQEQTLLVTFSPPTTGIFTCQLVVTSNGGDATRPLNGNGTAVPIPAIPSPWSPGGVALIALLAASLAWLLRPARRAGAGRSN